MRKFLVWILLKMHTTVMIGMIVAPDGLRPIWDRAIIRNNEFKGIGLIIG